jgi:hypothetical protein
MTLTITKLEIEKAIEEFVKSKGYMNGDKKLDINIICGRGEKGVRAEIKEKDENFLDQIKQEVEEEIEEILS